jgi:hypothetical protein
MIHGLEENSCNYNNLYYNKKEVVRSSLVDTIQHISTVLYWTILLHFIYNIVLKHPVALYQKCSIETSYYNCTTYWSILLHYVYDIVLKHPVAFCLQYRTEAACCTMSTMLHDASCYTGSRIFCWIIVLHSVYNIVRKDPFTLCLQYCTEALFCTIFTVLY